MQKEKTGPGRSALVSCPTYVRDRVALEEIKCQDCNPIPVCAPRLCSCRQWGHSGTQNQ